MPSQDLSNQIALPTFKELVLYTGNVMLTTTTFASKFWGKKSNTELVNAISDTLKTSLYGSKLPSYRYFSDLELLEVPDVRLSSRILPEDRDDVEVTAKLFYLDGYNEFQKSHIDKSIHHLKELLDINSIDTFIVSFNSNQSSVSMDKTWKDLENYVDKGAISRLGLSDFNCTQLSKFIESPDIKVKPSINQVFVDQCCSLPQDLIDLGKQHDIKITYNGDTTEILTTEVLSNLLRHENIIADSTNVKPRWVIKYDVFYKNRSVVADKGYIIVGDVL